MDANLENQLRILKKENPKIEKSKIYNPIEDSKYQNCDCDSCVCDAPSCDSCVCDSSCDSCYTCDSTYNL